MSFRISVISLATASLLVLLFASCSNPVQSEEDTRADSSEGPNIDKASLIPRPDGFNRYWFQGTAEITSYQLQQARYGQIHDGEAVMIFVTEDFSRSKQVKLDNPSEAGDDRVKVLKLNFTKNFLTGIYPYSLMTSVFMPVRFSDKPAVMKVSATSQDWCGHSFTQINKSTSGYDYSSFSYFENEGDQSLSFGDTMLESELWMRVRMGTEALPVGEIVLLPDAQHHRLRHTEYGPEQATATLSERPDSESEWAYKIAYEDLDREVTLYFEKDFPHVITGWEEVNYSGFGPNPERLTTTATRLESVMSDYWAKNRIEDEELRSQLQLD